MSAERDELAEVITATDLVGCGCCGSSTEVRVGPEEWDVEYPDRDEALARAILAAGYRKPRTITTVEELDALPEGAVVVSCYGDANTIRRGIPGLMPVEFHHIVKYGAATVLHEGGTK